MARLLAVSMLAVGLGAASAVHATDYYWDTNGDTSGTGGTGTWDLSNTFWSTSPTGGSTIAWPNGTGTTNSALFEGTAGTVTVGADTTVDVNQLLFNVSGYTLAGANAGSLINLVGTDPGLVANGATIVSAILGGSNGLTVSGTDSVTFTGNNTYTGNFAVTSGKVIATSIGNSGAASSIGAGSAFVLDGGTLEYTGTVNHVNTNRQLILGSAGGRLNASSSNNRQFNLANTGPIGFVGTGARTLTLGGTGGFPNTISSQIIDSGSGATSITKVDNNQWKLANDNSTFTGDVTVSGGRLYYTSIHNVGEASSLGAGNRVRVTSGSLIFDPGAANVTTSTDKELNISGNIQLTLNASATNSRINFNGQVTGNGTAFLSSGSGTIAFMSENNTYAGGLTIGNGATVLEVTKLADGGQASSLGTQSAAASNLQLGSDGSATLRYVGTSDSSTNRLFTIGSGSVPGVDSRVENTGTGTVQFTSTGTLGLGGEPGARTFTLGGTNTGDNLLNPTMADGTDEVSGHISLSFAKAGTGTWHLGGNNTYSGTTSINGGILYIDGDQSGATGDVNVASGATLGGNGIIGGTTTIVAGAHLAPGNSPGNLTFNDGLTLAGTYDWELGALSTANPGVDWDTVTITSGDVDITGALLSLELGSFSPDSSIFWSTDQEWVGILNNTGAGSLTGSFGAIDNSAWSEYGFFTAVNVGNDVNLTWTAVPEPTSAGLLAGAMAMLALSRRRRRDA